MVKKHNKTVVLRMDKELADIIKRIRRDCKRNQKMRIRRAVLRHYKK